MCTPACEHHLYPTSTAWAPSLCSLLSPAGSSASRWPQLWLQSWTRGEGSTNPLSVKVHHDGFGVISQKGKTELGLKVSR